jgi:cutinase
MRFAQVGMLAYATATAAAPAFNFPNFGGGLFQFPSWPTKSNAPSAIPSSRASNPSISPPQPSAVPSASQIKPPPSSSSASPAQSSAAVVTTPTNCTPQGAAGGNTEDGIKNPYCCTDVTIVFARGTTESGNVGTVAGPPLFKSLRAKIGANRVTVQGTIYPATWDVSEKLFT